MRGDGVRRGQPTTAAGAAAGVGPAVRCWAGSRAKTASAPAAAPAPTPSAAPADVPVDEDPPPPGDLTEVRETVLAHVSRVSAFPVAHLRDDQSLVDDLGFDSLMLTDLFTALVVRDGHCRLVPGCDRGPAWCDAHHVVPWEDGGPTSLDNMVLGCSRHHHLLHRQHWRQHLARDGTLTIETPDGRTWTTHARGTIPIDFPAAG